MKTDRTRHLEIALAAAQAVEPTTALFLCGGPILRRRHQQAGRSFDRYGLTGSWERDRWSEAEGRASVGCRPGRVDYTRATVFQEELEAADRKPIKAAIRRALHEAGLPEPTRITLTNRAHHDKIVVTEDGHPVINR